MPKNKIADIYGMIGKVMPKQLMRKFRQLLLYSSIEVEPHKFLGFMAVFGFLFALIISYSISTTGLLPIYLVIIPAFIAVELVFYLLLLMSIDSKTKFVEEVLPDALQLMSSNIRAGLTTDKALLMAARPEFGPLADEIRRIGRELMAGKSFAYSLLKTTRRIKSDVLTKTIDLMVNSIKSGGKLADLLDQISADVRDQQIIKKEIQASVLMYVLFIFIAIAFGAPLLFAMSSFLVKMLVQNMAVIAAEMPETLEVGEMPISIASVQITPEFIQMFAIISLSVSSFFGSIIIGLILKGNERAGLKFLPVLLLVSIGLFFLGGYLLDMMLGEMMEI